MTEYQTKEAEFLANLLQQAPEAVQKDALFGSLTKQLLGAVERKEDVRLLLKSLLDHAAAKWPAPVLLVCGKCGVGVPCDASVKTVYCPCCKMPYEFLKR